MSTELRMEELNKPKKYTVEQKLGILREWEKRGNGVEIADSHWHAPQRPTDNVRQERWYRALKQEEGYVMADYPSIEVARESLGHHIEFSNTQRPHQALWGFTPGEAHRVGNHTRLWEHLRDLQAQAREERRRYWREQELLNQHLSPQNLS